jgi:hypothetical protein
MKGSGRVLMTKSLTYGQSVKTYLQTLEQGCSSSSRTCGSSSPALSQKSVIFATSQIRSRHSFCWMDWLRSYQCYGRSRACICRLVIVAGYTAKFQRLQSERGRLSNRLTPSHSHQCHRALSSKCLYLTSTKCSKLMLRTSTLRRNLHTLIN